MNTIDLSAKNRIKSLLSLIFMIISVTSWSQSSNSDFQRIKLFNSDLEYSGIAISPDQNSKSTPDLHLSFFQAIKLF
jgi:hypothetical protein